MATVGPTLQFYVGLALVLGVLVGYLLMVYLGKSGRYFMQDIGLYVLYIGASLLGVSLQIVFGGAPAGG